MHITFCFLFVTYLQWGIAGTAIATFFSNLFIYVINELKTHAQTDIIELNQSSIFDKNVYRNFYEYL